MPKIVAEESTRSLQCDYLQYKWKLFASTAIHHHKDYMEKKLVIRNKF